MDGLYETTWFRFTDWAVNGDQRRQRLAALCHFTLPAPPIVYYGAEVGLGQLMAKGRLEEARLPMLWGGARGQALVAFSKDVTVLRREMAAVWRMMREALLVNDDAGLYAHGCGRHVVFLNNSAREATISLKRWRNGGFPAP